MLLAALGYGAVGIYEELLFRGYLLRNVAEGVRLGPLMPRDALLLSLALTSVAFGFAHYGNPNATLVSTFNISIAGIFLGLGYILTGRMAIPIGLHASWNFAQGNLFGFPVSGTSGDAAQVLVIEQGGPDLWTGGAFGPEAGLLGLLAMAVGVMATLAYVRWQEGATRVMGTLATYVAPTPDAPTDAPPE